MVLLDGVGGSRARMENLDSILAPNNDRLALAKIVGLIQAFECGYQDAVSCQTAIRAVQRIAVFALDKPSKPGNYWHGWLPDSEHINALPQPIRQYIHDLETRAAGDVAEIASLKEMVKALEAKLESCC